MPETHNLKRKADELEEEDHEEELGDEDDDLGYDDDEQDEQDEDEAPQSDADQEENSSQPQPLRTSRYVRPTVPRIVTALAAALESSDPGPAETSLIALINKPHTTTKRDRNADGSLLKRESVPAVVTAVEAAETNEMTKRDLEIINKLNKPFEEVEYRGRGHGNRVRKGTSIYGKKLGRPKTKMMRAETVNAASKVETTKAASKVIESRQIGGVKTSTTYAANKAPGPYEQWLLDQKNGSFTSIKPPKQPKKAIEPTPKVIGKGKLVEMQKGALSRQALKKAQTEAIRRTSQAIDARIQKAAKATNPTKPPPKVQQITSDVLAKLKREDAQQLLEPYFSEELKSNLFKFSRAGLVELVERKIKDGSIKPQQFWNVVNEHMPAESAPKPKEHARGNIKPNGPMAPPLMSPPLMSPPIPGMGPPIYAPPPPGSYRPYPYHYPRPVPPPIQLPIAPPIPPHAPEIQLYKYNFKTPSDIWNANKMGYPIGILVGGPSSPHGVSGTFYSSGLVAMTSDGIIRSTARDQVQFLFANLKTILKIMSASITDILNMTIYVKDIQLNGKEVKEEEEAFLGNSLGVTNNLVKTVGVTSLMEGAMVLVKVSVMVRRAHPGCFELQRIR